MCIYIYACNISIICARAAPRVILLLARVRLEGERREREKDLDGERERESSGQITGGVGVTLGMRGCLVSANRCVHPLTFTLSCAWADSFLFLAVVVFIYYARGERESGEMRIFCSFRNFERVRYAPMGTLHEAF